MAPSPPDRRQIEIASDHIDKAYTEGKYATPKPRKMRLE
jgi:hypothetical protein